MEKIIEKNLNILRYHMSEKEDEILVGMYKRIYEAITIKITMGTVIGAMMVQL